MRRVVAAAVAGVLLTACGSSSTSPADVRRDKVKAVVDAANTSMTGQLRSAVDDLLSTLSGQLKAGSLTQADYVALRTYALRIRGEAGLLSAAPPTTAPPTTAPPTTAPPTTAPPTTAPPAPAPTSQAPAPPAPAPTTPAPAKGKGKGGGDKKGGGSISPAPSLVPLPSSDGPVPESTTAGH
jgi:hypothetical protein